MLPKPALMSSANEPTPEALTRRHKHRRAARLAAPWNHGFRGPRPLCEGTRGPLRLVPPGAFPDGQGGFDRNKNVAMKNYSRDVTATSGLGRGLVNGLFWQNEPKMFMHLAAFTYVGE